MRKDIAPVDQLRPFVSKEMVEWLAQGWMKGRRREGIMFNIAVGKKTWDEIRTNPDHPLHEMQRRSIRKYKMQAPWRNFRRWFLKVTGIERRRNEKLRKRIGWYDPRKPGLFSGNR